MKLPHLYKYTSTAFVLVAWWILSVTALYAQPNSNKIRGVVLDAATQEPIPFVGVFFEGTTVGSISGNDGSFTVDKPLKSHILVAQSIGYTTEKREVTGVSNEIVTFLLSPSTYEMKEIEVRPDKERYRRKGNPAVEFVEELIKHRDDNSPLKHDYHSYDRYEKLTLALNDFSKAKKDKFLFKNFQFLFNYIDTSEVSGKSILTLSIKEQVGKNYYRKSPLSTKELITGKRSYGIDEILDQESMGKFYNEIFKEVDPFGEDITLFLNRFVSPLATIGPHFYKYYLLDTVQINGKPHIDLGFVPQNTESQGFVGHLFVTADSAKFISRVRLQIPRNINLNYIEELLIIQDYKPAADGTRILTQNDVIAEFKLIPGTQGFYARRTVSYDNHLFKEPETAIFDHPDKVIFDEEADVKPDQFWVDNRLQPIKAKENSVDRIMNQLRSVPVFYYTELVLKILISGYIETDKKNSKFDFGPMNTTLSFNAFEGVRLRVGGTTTAQLNPQLFARGYVAYGTGDGRFKYSGTLEYSFNKKKFHPYEYPVHSFRLSHSFDINQIGQQYLYTNKDNVFLSVKRLKDENATYLRKTELRYLYEISGGFSVELNAQYRTEYGTRFIPFINGHGQEISHYNLAPLELKLRYCPNEKFYQNRTERIPINKDAAIFTLSHKIAQQGFMGSTYTLNHTELGIQKRFWFSAFGHLDIILRGGKVWNKVPFPLLIIPNANLSYLIQNESFALMNPTEFGIDQYASWDVTYFLNGMLMNRIPLVKYLKLREVVSFKGVWGTLSAKNNPENDPSLMRFPHGMGPLDKNTPYMEASVGLDNIFTILRIDYVWRLSYREQAIGCTSGVRIALHFNF